MFNYDKRGKRQSQQGILIKQVTYAQGGPNLLSSGISRDSPLWGERMLDVPPARDLSVTQERGMWGQALTDTQARKEIHHGWLSLQPAFRTAPRFTPTPHLIDPAYLQGSPIPNVGAGVFGEQGALNPYTFSKPATQSMETPPLLRDIQGKNYPYSAEIPQNKYQFSSPSTRSERSNFVGTGVDKSRETRPRDLKDYPRSDYRNAGRTEGVLN